MRLRRAARNILIAAMLLWSPLAVAEDPPVREMLVVSGMVEQFADLGETFRAGITQQAGQARMPPELVEGLAEIAARQMDGEAYLQALEAGLALTLSPDEVEAVTAFYRSPFGERVKQAEVASSTAEALAEKEARRAEIRAALDADPTRLALATSMDEILLASEIGATTALAFGRAMMIGALEAAPPPVNQDALAAVESQLAELHGQLVAQMRERLLVTFAFTYRDFSNEELAAYVEFLKTEPARATYAALDEITSDFMKARAILIGKEFGALLREQKI